MAKVFSMNILSKGFLEHFIQMKQKPHKFCIHLNEIRSTAKLFSCVIVTFVVHDHVY